jgi:hypothetical protein
VDKRFGACGPARGDHAGLVDKIYHLQTRKSPTYGTRHGALATLGPREEKKRMLAERAIRAMKVFKEEILKE